jgi:murein DD-endopeptidase MepM/ murein hydrolase activator NlpD
MKNQWKKFFAAALVLSLRALRTGKRWTTVALLWLLRPLGGVGSFFFRHFFVRVYKVLLLVRRVVRRVLAPVKSRVLFLVANRYMLHIAIILLALLVSASSVRAREAQVSAATGSQTLLFSILTANDPEANPTTQDETPPVYQPAGINYLGESALRAQTDIDEDSELFLPRAPSSVGEGSVFVGMDTHGDGRSIAPRDGVTSYVVAEGDTIGSIAVEYQISVRTLLLTNNLGPRDFLKIGQSLKIPPVDGLLHTVKQGDTVEKIAKKYSADVQEILTANRLGRSSDLRIGDELIVPNGEPPAVPTPSKVATVPRPIAPIGSIFRPQAATPNRSARLQWPTSGHVITQYFGGWEHVNGWRIHTGLDVDGDYSSPIYASEDGIVTVSGWGTGYGYHVDIDHGGGMMTRYAHASKLYVKPGEQVRRGQVIAMVGTTGYSTGTHLHFEVRINGRPMNPIGYLR